MIEPRMLTDGEIVAVQGRYLHDDAVIQAMADRLQYLEYCRAIIILADKTGYVEPVDDPTSTKAFDAYGMYPTRGE